MFAPESLENLISSGIISHVIRPLMSGKEAQVYLVAVGEHVRVAKVYKEAQQRSFKHRTDYIEGRKVRNTRSLRAMAKKSRFGKAQVEAEWRNSEVDAIYRLWDAGVRVPEPFEFVDGVLVMELITDEYGEPAPRLIDVSFDEKEAKYLFKYLIAQVQHMLCAGIVHGDLSDFNILMSGEGPVIIDLPQAIDPAQNRNAQKLFLRDVKNVTNFLAKYAPSLSRTRYGEEMWDLYETGQLTLATKLTGRSKRNKKQANVSSLLDEIADVEREARARRERLGLPSPRTARAPIVHSDPTPAPKAQKGKKKRGGRNTDSRGSQGRPRKGERQDQPKALKPLSELSNLDAFLVEEDD